MILSFCCSITFHAQQQRTFKIHTIAFYNLENLFDFKDDPFTFDDDRTPEGKDHWTEKNYRAKLQNMARVISEIGKDATGQSPTIIGVCEIENRTVLEDLINEDPLGKEGYGIVHFDSPDRRGIDVALLYRKNVFTPSHYKSIELLLYNEQDRKKRIYTRDQLIVSGMLDGERIHIIVNHWPSRSGGEARSRPKRLKAAWLNKRIIDSLWSLDPYAKIVSMGDFNDDPGSQSIKKVLQTLHDRNTNELKRLYNPMEYMHKKGLGTLAYRDGWNLFDQIIISSELIKREYDSYRYYKAGIHSNTKLITSSGRYKGYPFRSFTDSGFTGGYSDHFPVYIYLIKEIDSSEGLSNQSNH
ncbi:MAG: endonuclease/exonuclease/phosphatase family protein [Bacteroidia bacterium]|nr:endonuclease/exonuclease/phosphatase family protein [Bacteroidia bacterium]NNF30954.1 endonuclease/exonuclease/phosphatase family protein [Flavobacteriaceae bacterium]MBT8276098.1 endonuclease/exonuclease/phosphatase family protein [Bacteroidia bacterium]NNJ82599.1 endonuclease/exonuclease/phosphatase family protein [Flavobacteriaceae bacterium]NNK53159.1 endonuclease/exonuclease/phosphatase family protein [Flavobacteriaceae bacterium]